MNKMFIAGISALSLLVASPVLAQSYVGGSVGSTFTGDTNVSALLGTEVLPTVRGEVEVSRDFNHATQAGVNVALDVPALGFHGLVPYVQTGVGENFADKGVNSFDYNVGAGVRYNVAPNWVAGLGYRYVSSNDKAVNSNDVRVTLVRTF